MLRAGVWRVGAATYLEQHTRARAPHFSANYLELSGAFLRPATATRANYLEPTFLEP